jgi:FkbM family methyltransferase
MIGRDIRLRGDEAHCRVHGFEISFPRRFLHHHVASEYEPETCAWLNSELAIGSTVLDVGAHIGFFSLVMGRRIGRSGRVVALEPSIENVHYILKNAHANLIENIEVIAAAASDACAVRRLNLNESSDSYSLYEHVNTATIGSVPVPVVTIDMVVRDLELANLQVVKIDAEGAEPDVLSGMSDVLVSFPRLELLIEWFPEMLRSRSLAPDELVPLLERTGRKLQILDAADGNRWSVDEAREAATSGALAASWYCNLLARPL